MDPGVVVAVSDVFDLVGQAGDGPQPANDRRAPIDYEHYIEKQIRPIVRTIGQVCDLDVEVALGGMGDLFRRRPASSDDAMPFEATGTETQQETR